MVTPGTTTKRIRILQVVGAMERGGTETWLMHVLRHIDRHHFNIHFLVHTTRPSAYDEEIRSLGSEIIPCLNPSQPWSYACNFNRVLKTHGPYNVVHSHVHHFSGFVLCLAHRTQVPIRIAHSHTSETDEGDWLGRRLYLSLTRRWIRQHATCRLAASREASTSLFGQDGHYDPRCKVHYCGIDLRPFLVRADRAMVRSELGLPAEAIIVGHIGRFVEAKNHEFLICIASAMTRILPNVYFLLLGDGPLRERIKKKAELAGIANRVIFAGVRTDVPRILTSAVDVVLMPSLWEGLPLALIEAQAAGLPCVISSVISAETDVDPRMIKRLPLSLSASRWAEEVSKMLKRAPPRSAEAPVPAIVNSDFNIEKSLATLTAIYEESP